MSDNLWNINEVVDELLSEQEYVETTIKDNIINIITNDDTDRDFGLRVLRPDRTALKIGDKLEPSYNWIDGVRTEEQMSGTSAIAVDINNINRSMRDLHDPPRNTYEGDVIALVAGINIGGGEDIGEIVLDDAEIIKLYDKEEFAAEISVRE